MIPLYTDQDHKNSLPCNGSICKRDPVHKHNIKLPITYQGDYQDMTYSIYLPGSCDKGMTEIWLTGVGVSWGRGCSVLFVPMGWKFLIKKRLGRTNATCLHYAL